MLTPTCLCFVNLKWNQPTPTLPLTVASPNHSTHTNAVNIILQMNEMRNKHFWNHFFFLCAYKHFPAWIVVECKYDSLPYVMFEEVFFFLKNYNCLTFDRWCLVNHRIAIIVITCLNNFAFPTLTVIIYWDFRHNFTL